MSNEKIAELLKSAKRIVVKVGTSSLTYDNGKLHIRSMELLVRQLADLKNSGKEVLLVSSGAVGAGLGKLNLMKKPCAVPQQQALAAVGQGILMQNYEKFFGEYGVNVAQVLLTKEDMADQVRLTNIRNTFDALFDYDVVPVVNENDTITFSELDLKVGDNDTLAARVATVVNADLLILLSDIDGLYTSNPHEDENAQMISVVHELNDEIYAMAGGSGSSLGTGGMLTKLKAAKIANEAGIAMVLTNSATESVLYDIIHGNWHGTYFAT